MDFISYPNFSSQQINQFLIIEVLFYLEHYLIVYLLVETESKTILCILFSY